MSLLIVTAKFEVVMDAHPAGADIRGVVFVLVVSFVSDESCTQGLRCGEFAGYRAAIGCVVSVTVISG
jgi:hypothetical protein